MKQPITPIYWPYRFLFIYYRSLTLVLVWIRGGCMCIHFNPHVLEWIGMELSLIPLKSTSTHVDWDEYMCIQTRWTALGSASGTLTWTTAPPSTKRTLRGSGPTSSTVCTRLVGLSPTSPLLKCWASVCSLSWVQLAIYATAKQSLSFTAMGVIC